VKSLPSGLAAHYQQVVTTTTRLIQITRTDGVILRFTSHPVDITVGTDTYLSVAGFSPTGLHSAAGLAVDNMDLVAALNSAYVTAADILAGVYDNARMDLYRCNYRDTAQGVEILKTGYIGELKIGNLAYTAELRGLAQSLQQVIGEVSQAACRADLFDTRCKVVRATYTFAGAVTAVTDQANFADNVSAAITGKVTEYFSRGEIAWLTGNNAGRVMEIKRHVLATGVASFSLFLPMTQPIQIGDTFDVSAGCDKSLQGTHGCKLKFNNVINHRGDPYHRNKDFQMDFPDAR